MAKGKYEKWLEPEGLLLLTGWARDGMTDKEIADKCEIAESTLNEWKKKYEKISEAIKKGKEVTDYEVEHSLHDKCVGRYVEEEQAFKCKSIFYDKNGKRCEKESVKVVKVQKFVPPDTLAIAMWLNNRRPDKWRKNANKEKLDERRFEHDKDIDGKKFW